MQGIKLLCMAGLLAAAPLAGADVALVAAMKERALLSVNGAAPRAFAVGATLPDGSKLVAVSAGQAVIEEDGKRYTVRLGEFAAASAPAGRGGALTLAPDPSGHYNVFGEINGVPTRMVVDTGATLVAIPAAQARSMGIDYRRQGRRAFANTAAGSTEIWVVMLERVTVGELEFARVEAAVHEAGLPVVLLGNSILSRMDMKTEAGILTLSKRL